MTSDNFFLRYWLPLLAYAALIFYLSSMPSSSFPDVSITGFDDKAVHCLEYALLTLLIYRLIINGQWRNGIRYWGTFSFLLSSFYGITDEVHQMFITSRHAGISDVIADMLGSLLMVFVIKKGLFFRIKHL